MAAGTYTLLETTGGTITGMFENVDPFNLFGVNVTVNNTGTAITVKPLDSDLIFADLEPRRLRRHRGPEYRPGQLEPERHAQ
ncbi:MAG: hypothetical protein R3C45_17325 [Phycisphaerales bacterium]